MKDKIHPKNYRKVVFEDASSALIGSTIATDETTTWTDKKEYPRVKVEISSASHRFTPASVVDTAGRVEKFKRAAAKSAQVTTRTPNKTVREWAVLSIMNSVELTYKDNKKPHFG